MKRPKKNFKIQKFNCQNKNRYDKKGAISARNLFWRKQHKELRIYHCPICNHWHLTSLIYERR